MRVLVTGASGFVGRGLVARAASEPSLQLHGLVRPPLRDLPAHVTQHLCRSIRSDTSWLGALDGVDAVVHLAARVHLMRETADDSLGAYRATNVDDTIALARAAAAAGVRRFVFLSSVKVNGDAGQFRETDPPTPSDPYGISKSEAEAALRSISAASGMEVVIVRPPLVYGPGVRANFRRLADSVERGIPLPFGAVRNRRSLVALDNLADFLLLCLRHPAAANETFFVSDGEDLSTPELVRRIARALGRRTRLIAIPVPLLTLAAAALGKRAVAQRVLGSLQVDIGKARARLGWIPPVTVDEALHRMLGASS